MKGRRRLRKYIASVMFTMVMVVVMTIGNIPASAKTVRADDENFLTFKGEAEFTLSVQEKGWNGTMEYSTDKVTWNTWNGEAIASTDTAPYVLYVRGVGNDYISRNTYNAFSLSNPVECYGNIMTLLDYTNPNNDTVKKLAFYALFFECSNLKSAPDLPATKLESSCYSGMFYGCTSLKSAPELPATTLAEKCYDNMFKGCTSLKSLPELPATSLVKGCYVAMFSGCTGILISDQNGTFDGISYDKEYMISSTDNSTDISNATNAMFYNTGGKFKGTPEINKSYYVPDPDYSDYLTFTGESQFTLSVGPDGIGWDGTMEYSTDAIKWNTWDGSVISSTGTAPYVLYLRGSGNTQVSALSKSFKLEKAKVACSGNVMTLLDYEHAETYDKVPASAFNNLFRDCRNLTSAPELPAKYLNIECYHEMFLGCTGLKNAPELPATNLAPACYNGMFENCTGLEKAPELPATTLADSCYSYMFKGCTGLKNIPELPAINLQRWCYLFMFEGCTGICISDQKGTFDGVTYGKEYRIPSENTGTDANNSTYDMFSDTGGQFKGTPSINTTYYLPVKLMTASVDDTTVDYDGAPHGITVSVTDPAEGTTIKYGLTEGTYNLDECPTITNVKDSPKIIYYMITADGYGEEKGSATVTINAVDPITPTGVKATYGQTLADIELPSGWAWDDDTQSVGNVGTNKFKAKYTSTDTNYNSVNDIEISVEVGKADNTVATLPTAKTLDYSGSAQELIVAGQSVAGKMQYAIGDENGPTETYSETIPAKTEAGTYYIWYKAGADENHNESEAGYVTPKIRAAIGYKVTFKVVNGSWNDEATGEKTVTLSGFEGDTLKLSADDIPAVGDKPETNHKKGSWNAVPSTDTEITADTEYTYTYAEKSIVSHTVTFKVENGSWNDGTADDIIVTLSGYEDETLKLADGQIPAVGAMPGENKKEGGWDTVPDTETAITDDVTCTYSYIDKDAISVKVTFKVINGSWNDGTALDKVVTLNGYEGDTLTLAEEDIPSAGEKPEDTYKAGGWDTVPDADTEQTVDVTYTYSYAKKDTVIYTATFKVENGTWNDGTTDDIILTLSGYEGDALKFTSDDIPSAGEKPADTYKAGQWDTAFSAENAITGDTTYTYTYKEKDKISKTVTFKVKNGTWSDGTSEDRIVTLNGYEGDILKLSADQIPGVGDKPGDGYTEGEWDAVPDTDKEITLDSVYTYTYAEKIEVVKPEYYFVKGADSTVTEGDETEQEIVVKRSIDDEHCKDHHRDVEFGGVILEKDKDYLVEYGSTIVKIKGSVIKKLKPGVYTIKVIFDDGIATTTLTVKEKTTESTTEATTEAAKKPAEKKKDTNAATGDDINLWIALMFLSMSGMAVLTVGKKKRNK